MTPSERRIDMALLALAMLGSGGLSLFFGQDFNFDQRHYHYYLGWSLVAGRLDRDIAPAGIGTYLNPVLHLPTYLGITYLPPRLFGFLLGAVHGLNAFLAYRLAARVVDGHRRWQVLAAVTGLVAALGPGALSLLGTTFGDNLASVPALAALLLLVGGATRGDTGPVSGLHVALVGVLGGFATGLKLTLAAFHVGLAAAVAVIALRTRSVRLAVAFVLGTVLGGLASGGYWALQLWERLGNPVFPMANGIFQSRYFDAVNFRDERWQARSLQDLWLAPAEMAAIKTTRLQEAPFRDPRCFVVVMLACGVAAHRLLRGRRTCPRVALAPSLVLVYWFTAYFVWFWLFFYYRYFSLGECLAPVAILALLTLIARPSRLVGAWLALGLAIVLGTSAPRLGRLPWSDSWYRVRLPESAAARNAAVVVEGGGLSFVLPSFPPETRFFSVWQLPGFVPLVARELSTHPGPVFRLRDTDEPAPGLQPLGLSDAERCEIVRARRVRLWLCRQDLPTRSQPGPGPTLPSSAP